MAFSIIIPTYKRPESLSKAMNTILAQTVKPAEVIIIDDDTTSKELLDVYRCQFGGKGIAFRYYKKDHKKERQGLSESKNIAIKLAQHDVIIIDDDIELAKNFIEEIESCWKKYDAEWFAGVGGRIQNSRHRHRFEKWFHTFFKLTSIHDWDVTDVGFQVWNEEAEMDQQAFYLHGGLCALKKAVSEKLTFTEFSGGRTGLEDVDFCLRAKQQGYFFAFMPSATANHYHAPAGRESLRNAGRKETANRIDIFRRLSKKTPAYNIWFAWSLTGWILRAFISGQFRKGFGMIEGIFFSRNTHKNQPKHR